MTNHGRPSPHHPTAPRTVSWPLVILAASLNNRHGRCGDPACGVVSNTILAQGPTAGALKEKHPHRRRLGGQSGRKGNQILFSGPCCSQPAGRTGWHSTPAFS